MRLLWRIGLGAAVLLGGFAAVRSQTAATARVPQFENDSVKVWKTTVQPHQPTELHRHDHPRVVVALTGGTMEFIGQDGAKERHVWEAGKAYWLPYMPAGALHSDSNPGDKPIEVMVVELEKEQ